MKNKKIKMLSIVFIALFIILFSVNTLKASGSVGNIEEYIIVTVEKGDTLWNIASENCRGNRDIRKTIYDLKKVNKLATSNITPGQKIKIPVDLSK